MNKINDRITVILFLLMIFGITTASILTPVKTFSENENRMLAQRPEISKEDILSGEFESAYEEFVTDQFVRRDQWIELKTNVERLIGKKEINGVYFGTDGYLIEKHTMDQFNQTQLNKNIQRLGQVADKYENLLGSGRVKIMLIPTAAQILTEKLPKGAPSFDQSIMIEEAKKIVPQDCFIDITEELKEQKDEYLYYRTDHHWTSLGAFTGYQKWAKACGFQPFSDDDFIKNEATDQFYGTIYSKVNVSVKPDQIILYEKKQDMDYKLDYNLGERKSETLYDMEQLEGKDKYAVFLGGNNAVVQINTKLKNGRKLLLIKDSYAHSIAPFVVNHFEETYMIDLRYFNMGIESYIKELGITDILVLYNVIHYGKDTNTLKLIE